MKLELLFTERRIDLLRDNVDIAFRLTRSPPEDWVAQPVLPFVVQAYAVPSPAWPLAHPRALATQALLLAAASCWRRATACRSI